MDIPELTKLNKLKKKASFYLVLVCLFIAVWIGELIFSIISGLSSKLMIIYFILLIPIVFFGYFYVRFFAPIQEALYSYIESQFPNWKKDDDAAKNKKLRETLFEVVLPFYDDGKRDLAQRGSCYSFNNDSLKRSITQMCYTETVKHTVTDSKGHRSEETYITHNFTFGMIFTETQKELNSTTYFQTNNYPKKTPKEIMEEKPNIELPKVELPDAALYNIDVYTDNKTTAEALASKELFEILQNLKEQFNLYYVRAVFYHNYIFSILRHNKSFDLEPFFVNIPRFKNIDFPFIEKVVNNVKILTDTANQAEDFIRNI